jgi:hypothetical protein
MSNDPSIHDQEHLLDELVKPSIEQQVKDYAHALAQAKSLQNQIDDLADALSVISDMIEDEQDRLEQEADMIRDKAMIKVSKRAYDLYWDRWTENEFGATAPKSPPKISQPESLERLRKQKKQYQQDMLKAIKAMGESINQGNDEHSARIHEEEKRLGLDGRSSFKKYVDKIHDKINPNLREELKKKRKQYEV